MKKIGIFHVGLPGDPEDQNLAFQVIEFIWNLVRVYNFHISNSQFVSIREVRSCHFDFFSACWYVTAFTPARKCQNVYSKNKNVGTCPPPKINSTADIFCSASNTHRLELVILPVRGWPSITVKGSLRFGVKNRGTWINGQGAQGACRERICLFVCVSGSTIKSQEHLGLRKEKLQYGEFAGLPSKSSFSHNLLLPQDRRVNIFILKRNH